MKAQAIHNAVAVITHSVLPSGVKVVVAPCDGYQGFDKLPKGITFNGVPYGLTGWNSDRNVAYFRTDKVVALS